MPKEWGGFFAKDEEVAGGLESISLEKTQDKDSSEKTQDKDDSKKYQDKFIGKIKNFNALLKKPPSAEVNLSPKYAKYETLAQVIAAEINENIDAINYIFIVVVAFYILARRFVVPVGDSFLKRLEAKAEELNLTVADCLTLKTLAIELRNKPHPPKALSFVVTENFERMCSQLLFFPEDLPANTPIKDMPAKIDGLYEKVAIAISSTAKDFLGVENLPEAICNVIVEHSHGIKP
jgi:hypothetical protein